MVEQLRQYRLYILMFALNLAVLIGVIYLLRRPEPRVITVSTPALRVATTEALIQVQVRGAISQPGVYKLSPGSRVSDALDAAGGARPDADLDQINLAFRLSEGDDILVPARATVIESPAVVTPRSVSPPAAKTSDSMININTATVERLDTLPRIGPVLAQRIVDYRTQMGPFKRIEDIKNVNGIGDAVFEDIKALITVQ
jgi:competence protein ComEA